MFSCLSRVNSQGTSQQLVHAGTQTDLSIVPVAGALGPAGDRAIGNGVFERMESGRRATFPRRIRRSRAMMLENARESVCDRAFEVPDVNSR